MFVFPRESLPKDPVFPADLEKLGYVSLLCHGKTKDLFTNEEKNRYFVNDNDQIKMISNPKQDFLYKINANERYNEMQKEAMNSMCFSHLFAAASQTQ